MKHACLKDRNKGVQARCACALFLLITALSGCAHYPLNKPLQHTLSDAQYRGRPSLDAENSEELLLMLTFSGGGTRAAAFSYGVLEALKDTEVVIDGQRRPLLEEVDLISGVSGGSFTAAYYGLFGERTFEDFESRFLKKNIQRDLARATLFNPVNWVKLFSPYYDRSDLAAEYYDKHVFDRCTFKDFEGRGTPKVMINATDMTYGTRFAFSRRMFDAVCSDLSSFPVGRACAASSAVPIVFSPITLRNYAGSCGYHLPEVLSQALDPPRDTSSRRFDLANQLAPYLDRRKKPYIHLVDGGVADNLGLRAILETVILMGDLWTTLTHDHLENVRKVVFVIVNAETEVDDRWDRLERIPPFAAMVDSYSSIAISRYNVETVALLRESLGRWTDEVRAGRCGSQPISTEPGSCGDIRFYIVEVKFDALPDEAEQKVLKRLPTSFRLQLEQVDHLRDAARRIVAESRAFRELLDDLREGS